jgi:tetratricopeptide (TPR) repeat protein
LVYNDARGIAVATRGAVVLAMLLGVASPSWGDALRDRAHQEFTAAQVDFAAARYEQALEHLQRAYALAPHPELLFNIARCFEELHRVGAAVDAYDRYLAVQPSDTAARDRVEALRKELIAHPSPSEPPTTPSPTPTAPLTPPPTTPPPVLFVAKAPPPTPVSRRWWLWTTVAGVVVVGAGVGLAVALTRPASTQTFPPLMAQ